MRKRNQYTEEFKKDAVRLMQGRGTRSIEDVAAGIGVGQSMLTAGTNAMPSNWEAEPRVHKKSARVLRSSDADCVSLSRKTRC